MALVQWESLQRVVRFNLQTQNLVDNVLKTRYNSVLWVGNGGHTSISSVQVKEIDAKIILHIRIPNIDLEKLEIRITPETLLIQGEQREKVEIVGYFHLEYPAEEFQSLIPFPHPVDPDSAEIKVQRDNTFMLILSKSISGQYQSTRLFPVKK